MRWVDMIYGFGSNGSGQLGIGHLEDVSEPQEVKVSTTVVSTGTSAVKRLVAGGNHSLLLFEDGTVLATGNNEDGRCGRDDRVMTSSPLVVSFLPDGERTTVSRFYDIAATWTASIFVSKDRRSVYVCGTGEHGELGLGPDRTSAMQPMRIELPDMIESIASCLAHTVVVLSNDQVWGWGRGRKGQLGEPKQDIWAPRRIVDVDFIPVKAVCGADFTCILGSRDNGNIVMLGSDKKDRFGLRASTPPTVRGWTDVSASWGSVFIQMEDNIVAWGRNDRGQLPPSYLPPIKSFGAGSEHWLALTTDDRVLAGGWGEHGNCGTPTDHLGVVKAGWNVISTAARVEQVFAGCATSFIMTSTG